LGVNGVVNITGSCNVTGAQHVIAGRSTFLNGIALSGGLTTNPIGGAVEYGNDGKFYFTNEIAGSPNRALANPVYSYMAPQPFFVGNGTSGTVNLLLGSTGIYLNTGTYHIYYNTRLTKATTNRAIDLGITGSAPAFTHRFAIGEKRNYINGPNTVGYSYSSWGNITPSASVFVYGTGGLESMTIDASGTTVDGGFLSNFIFDCTVTITGLTKVQPYCRFNQNIAAEAFTGTHFFMRVTQLTTGTGHGLASASGPWSNA
jgi:hypothetical protein